MWRVELIEVNDLYAGYNGSDILKGISLKFREGEMVGALGPNGSGKTTLINVMSGILKPRKGDVSLNGVSIKDLGIRDISRQIAVAPQKTEISFPFKCFSITLMGRNPHVSRWGFYSSEDERIALDAMVSTDTLRLHDRPITNVSGGEAQLVTVARILAQQTRALLLDEVTSNLDVCHKMAVFDLLKTINLNGATVISVMHDLNLAAMYCDRLIFMKKGQIILDGPTHEVFQESNLREIYETDVQISYHPVTKTPQAHFIPAHFSRFGSVYDPSNGEAGVGDLNNRRHGTCHSTERAGPKDYNSLWRLQ